MLYIHIYFFVLPVCSRCSLHGAMGGRKRACALDAAGASAYRGFDVTCV